MEKTLFEKKTEFGVFKVAESDFLDEPARFLLVNGSMESAMYLNEDRKYDPVFPYMHYFSYALAIRPELMDTLLIGGGGFAYPKFYVHEYPEKTIDAIEISPLAIELAGEYFGLKEVQEEAGDRLRVINADGFAWLKSSDETYDIIINDAFLGRKAIGREDAELENVIAHLKKDGIYMVNCVTAARGLFAGRGRKLMKSLKKHFKNTMMILCDDEEDLYHRQNILYLASDGILDLYPDAEEGEAE